MTSASLPPYAPSSYLLPQGFGLLPLVTGWGVLTRKPWAWTDPFNKWTGQNWAWSASLLFAIAAEVWIIVEMILIGFYPQVQVPFVLLPLMPVWLLFRPSVREHLKL